VATTKIFFIFLQFSTGAGKDSPNNFPLKYSFGYIVNELTVSIGKFYENFIATTQLPFSDNITTFFDICDNNNACNRVFGEIVSANLEYEYSKEEVEFKLQEFESTLKRSEYSKSFNTAVVFVLTKPKFTSHESDSDAKMLNMLKNELNKLKSDESSGFMYQQNVVEFIEMSKNLMSILKAADETFIEDLLSLSEQIKAAQRSKRATFTSKLSSNVVSHDVNYMKNILELSDMLLKSENESVANREKGKIVKKVHEFVVTLCQDKNLNTLKVPSKSVVFEVTKVYSQQLFIEKSILPGEEKAEVLFTSSNMNFPADYLCVGKIKFAQDFFDTSSTDKNAVYEVLIVQNGRIVPTNEISEYVTGDFAGDSGTTCEIFDGQWKSCEKQKSNGTRFSCKCKTNEQGAILKTSKKSTESATSPAVTPFTFLSTRSTETVTKKTTSETQTTEKTSEPDATTTASATQAANSQPTIRDEDVQAATTATVTTETRSSMSDSNTPEISTTFPTSAAEDFNNSKPEIPSTQLDETATTKITQEPAGTTVSSTQKSQDTTKPAAQTTQDIVTRPIDKTTQTTLATTKSNSVTKKQDDLIVENNQNSRTTADPLLSVNITGTGGNESAAYVAKGSSSSWTLIIILLVFFLVIIALFLFHKCRQYASSNLNLPEVIKLSCFIRSNGNSNLLPEKSIELHQIR
jgi:hypothetical protein